MEEELSKNKNNDKVAKVLKKFLDPNFKVKNDVYLNLFLTHLIGKGCNKTPEMKQAVIDERKQQFCEWLTEAAELWQKRNLDPPAVILSFAVNLSELLCKNEETFLFLLDKDAHETLIDLCRANRHNDASVTLGYVSLLHSFLEHNSGTQWILKGSYWKDILTLGREAHTMYIRKKAYEFIAKLLQKTQPLNEEFCSNLVSILIQPLRDSLCMSDKDEPFIVNKTLFENLKPNLLILSEVMERLLKELQIDVLNIFFKFQLLELTKKLLFLSQIEEFSAELIKIRCILLFSKFGKEVMCKSKSVTQVAHDSNTLYEIQAIFDMLQSEMEKDHVKCVVKMCHFAQILYCRLAGGMPLCIRKGEPIEFQNQMILFQIMPILMFLAEKAGLRLEEIFRREYVNKLVKMAAIRSMTICYKWKENLKNKHDNECYEDMTFALQYMSKAKKMLNKEIASVFLSPLVYLLKSIAKQEEIGMEVSKSAATLYLTTIETIIDLVETFDLTWKDCIETISVLSIACDILQLNHWPQKLVISGLKLLKLALSKNMSAEMVLLSDKPDESNISQTGCILYGKCHNGSWEIRDTALENVHTLSVNAISKFPSYTKILIDAELPQLVVSMALKDAEFYVRSTAFLCLQEMVQIEDIWNIINTNGFLDTLMNVFANETEGVVRKEAAALVYRIYKHQQFPEEELSRLYDVMTHAVVGDLHWEVKCNALDFWFHVFENHLNDQGMIDYTFPSVTFSKELRKIVTLTDEEIRKRIIKVLNQLSHTGCLYVMKSASLDEYDVEVSRKVSRSNVDVVKLLKSYKVSCENVDFTQPLNPLLSDDRSMPSSSTSNIDDLITDCLSESPFSPSVSLDFLSSPSPACLETNTAQMESDGLANLSNVDEDMHGGSDNHYDPIKADAVLEELLNSNDMAFLQKVYNPSDEMTPSTQPMRKKTFLAPSEYIKFIFQETECSTDTDISYNFDEFNSLLDDILKEYNVVPDVNNMDCY